MEELDGVTVFLAPQFGMYSLQTVRIAWPTHELYLWATWQYTLHIKQ